MKKTFTFILTFFIMLFTLSINATDSIELTELRRSNGSIINYRGSNEPVLIPTEYIAKEQEFRGVWVSQLVGDVPSYTTETQFKNALLNVLDNMEAHNLNTIIYHLRIMNDALYDTDLSPIASYVNRIDFEEWDYLTWFIDEVHSRGMEFHAWLNPYRIANSVIAPETVAKNYAAYPKNPASNPENILNGSGGTILNPGEPAVRKFVVDVSMEIIEKYDVDAIHFDDYFYISGANDAHTRAKYNTEGLSTEDWRRKQVDLFIKDLSDEMTRFNNANNRQVQLGISPSGIWRNNPNPNEEITYNENGDAITNGSYTSGFAHYGNYLYSDTKKWIDEEWIDYIIPQVYWGFTQPVAPFADIVDWWAQVVRYKDVNLYIGMGLYMIDGGDSYWNSDPMQAAKQVLYTSKHEEVDGITIYSYKHLNINRNQSGFRKLIDEYWTNPAIPAKLDKITEVIPNKVGDVNLVKTEQGFVLEFEPVKNAKRYAIYRNTGEVDITDPNQLVKVIGNSTLFDLVIADDSDNIDVNRDYNYAVVSISGTNTKGEAKYLDTKNPSDRLNVDFAVINDPYFSSNVIPGERFTVYFNEGIVLAGGELSYELYYSYNQKDWYLSEERITRSGTSYYTRIDYPLTIKPLYFKVVGKNELGLIESDSLMATPSINDMPSYFNLIDTIIKDKFAKIISG